MLDRPRAVMMVLEATFPVQGGGGAESQVFTISKCMLARGVQITVVVPMVSTGRQIARENVEGLDVIRIAYPKIRVVGGLILLIKLGWLLFARRKHYKVIHAHIANNMAAVCAVMGALIGTPVFVKLTGMKELSGGILDRHLSVLTWLKKSAIKRATMIQATSSHIRAKLVECGFEPSRTFLLPNGVDVSRFAGTAKDEALRKDLCGDSQLVGVFVGRLAPEKGHDLLLDAWASVFVGRTDVKLVLVGDGSLRTLLEMRVKELNIEGQVIFTGHTDNVSQFLAIADFGLLTSHNEGLSNALLEYMACGLPVIGSRISGTEDFVVPEETGLLFESGRSEELAKCLASFSISGGTALRLMGECARRRVVSIASLEAVTGELIRCYESKMNPTSQP